VRRPLAALTVLALAGPGLAACGSAPAPHGASRSSRPAFRVAHDAAAPRPRGRYLTARLQAPVAMRAAPGGRTLGRLRTRTEFGSPKVLGVLRRRGGWLRVVTPERPNARPAWIPAAHVRLGATNLSLHVDRSARRLELRRGRRVLRAMPVAVGRPGTPTPLGRFAVTDKLRTRQADSPYGCCALALSGHQTKLIDGWPGGDRLAIHATPQPETIGHAASLGCMRAPTRGVRGLLRTVPLGTPVFVVA
jgi:lipoprotein-anchoring transpeptidase ErfK/SrfK